MTPYLLDVTLRYMKRNTVQTVTLPVLILANSVKEADGWGTFLEGAELDKSGFVRVVKDEDVKMWLRTDFTQRDRALFIGASRLKRAYDSGDDYAVSQAQGILQPYVQDLAPIDDIALDLKTREGKRMSIRIGRKWNATRWNFSGLLRNVLDSARLVMWFSEKDSRFLPALFCPDRKTAAFAFQFIGRIRVCPKCDAPFIPSAGNVDYCCPAHREAYRVARSRWRAKQKLEGRKKSS